MRLSTFFQLPHPLTLFFICFFTLVGIPKVQGQDSPKKLQVKNVLSVEVDASINPATANYLETSFEKAQKQGADLLLMKLNTPGGLVTTTKDILKIFGESNIPVVVWVTPSGASATSAGAIIASGAHLLYMNEGTNIGAATPIQMGGDIKQKDAKSKAVNDLVALVKSLSESHKRNPEGFQKMIEEAASYTSQEADKEGLINGIASTEKDLWQKLDRQTLSIQGQKRTLHIPSPPQVTVHEMDAGQKLLNIFANPTTAYILFLIGAALIYLELQAPGGMIAGSLGALCLILAGIGFQVLPLNIGALGLILLAFLLLALEVFVTSYGVLTVAGIASLIAGSLFLFRTEDSYIELSQSVIFSAVGALLAFIAIVALIIAKTHKHVGSETFNDNVGHLGSVLSEMSEYSLPEKNQYVYQVKVSGELWKAHANEKFEEGEKCKVTKQDSDEVMLEIEKTT